MRANRRIEEIKQLHESTESVDEFKKTRGRFKKLGRFTLKPYEGREELPRCEEKKSFKLSDSRFFCNGNNTVGYKLIRVYRDKSNQIKRERVMTLKPHIKKRLRDKDVMSILKIAQIPGIIG